MVEPLTGLVALAAAPAPPTLGTSRFNLEHGALERRESLWAFAERQQRLTD